MIDYEVGQIPARPLGIIVKDEDDNLVNTFGYASVGVEMLGSDNEQVDISGATVEALTTELGAYVVTWPKDRSLFTKSGKYLIRLALRRADGSVDYTRTREIRVRRFGRLNN